MIITLWYNVYIKRKGSKIMAKRKLMNKGIEQKFKKYPLYSQDGKGMNAKVVVKYFNPYGSGTWLITEGDKMENGDWRFFGYCHIHRHSLRI